MAPVRFRVLTLIRAQPERLPSRCRQAMLFNRDRGRPRDPPPPTPPSVRVRTRRFGSVNQRGSDRGKTQRTEVTIRHRLAQCRAATQMPCTVRRTDCRGSKVAVSIRGCSNLTGAGLPDLPPQPLMVVDFAIICSLVRLGRPYIWFLFIRSWLCYTLPSDPASRRRPCVWLDIMS